MPTNRKMESAVTKRVACTHCDQTCEVGHRAMSVVCPHCNKRLILENSKISGYCGVREFATCGDVVVEKNGHMAALVKVGNLTVKGHLRGNVIARGCVSIRRTGTLKGDVRAPRLHVESGAHLDGFLWIGEVHSP